MGSKRLNTVLLGLASVSLVTGAARAADSSPADLQTQVDALKAEVQDLKAHQQYSIQAVTEPTTLPSAPDADKSVQMAATPATSPVTGPSTGITAGWNNDSKQFFIGSTDGNSYFHPGIIFQGRYNADWHRKPDKWTNGFELRRMKFYFDGYLFTPDLTYKFQWQDTQSGGTPTLEYGWAQLVFLHDVGALQGDIGLKAGQTKNYVFKEQAIVADTNQLAVERSLLDSTVGGNALGGPLVEGVDLVYTGKKSPVHVDLLFNGGDGGGLSNFTDVTVAGIHNNFGAAARVDYKVFGDWTDNADFTGKQAKKDFLDFGGGVDFDEGATAAPVGTPSSNTVRWDGDFQYTHAGRYVLYGAYQGDYIGARGPAHGTLHRTDMGALLQGGYFVTPGVELFARYDFVTFDGDFKVGGRDLFQEASLGVNWFLGHDGSWGNHFKASVDVNYLPFGTPALTGLDYVAAPLGHDSIVIRSQVQLWI